MGKDTQPKKPIVTIGVCFRNCEHSVKGVVDTLLAQDFPHENVEVIFIDDGSKDGTLSCVLDYVPSIDMYVRVFHQEWKGLGSARNLVVNKAKGEYVLWVDANMTLARDYVRKQVELMQKNPRIGIAKGMCGLSPKGNWVSTLENVGWVATHVKNGGKITPKVVHLGTAGCIYRISAIRQVGGFDENIRSAGEDTEAAYRINKAGWLLVLANDTTFYVSRPNTWNKIWKTYFMYGYNLHYIYRKDKNIITLCKMLPMVSLIAGLLDSFVAYRLTRRKLVFLLPLHYFFRMTAWFLGFARNHIL